MPLTLKLARIIARGWTTFAFLPILVFLGRFVLDLSANTCQTHHMTLQPWPLSLEVLALLLMQVFVLRQPTKFEVPFGRYWAFTVWALIRLVTLTFDLYIGSRSTHTIGFHPAKFGLPRPFRSRVMLRHGTDRHTDGQTDRQTDTRSIL